MQTSKQNVRYPINLDYRNRMREAHLSVKYVAKKLGYTVHTISLFINGHYKGENIIPKIDELLKNEGV